MKSQEYQEKIDKVRADIAKKEALIEKRFAQAQKKIDVLNSTYGDLGFPQIIFEKDENVLKERIALAKEYFMHNCPKDSEGYRICQGKWNDFYWDVCDLEDIPESIINARQTIKDKEETISRYEDLRQKALVKEESLRNLPESMIELKDRTIEAWDAWDVKRKDAVRQAHTDYYALSDERRKAGYAQNKELEEELGKKMNEIYQSFSSFEWHELYCMSEEEIHRRNVQGAEDLVENLYDRVCKIVDTIEDASNLKVTAGNEGFAVINGLVKGHGKVARVQSVGAGGWNIQRWHIRTLVHEVKGVA